MAATAAGSRRAARLPAAPASSRWEPAPAQSSGGGDSCQRSKKRAVTPNTPQQHGTARFGLKPLYSYAVLPVCHRAPGPAASPGGAGHRQLCLMVGKDTPGCGQDSESRSTSLSFPPHPRFRPRPPPDSSRAGWGAGGSAPPGLEMPVKAIPHRAVSSRPTAGGGEELGLGTGKVSSSPVQDHAARGAEPTHLRGVYV